MKRLALEEVQAAYAETGLLPQPGVTCASGLACALGAIYAKWHPAYSKLHTSIFDVKIAFNHLGYSYDYLNGVINGFDGVFIRSDRTEEYVAGEADGKLFRESLVK